LGRSATLSSTQRSRSRGFSMVELSVSMTVVLILSAIAIPELMRSFRTYQLNDAASRLSDSLKFTRFEAVRRNTPVTMQIKQSGSDWNVWTDSDGDTIEDPTEKQILITGFVTLLPAGGPPGTGGFVTPLGTSNFTIVSGTNGTVKFDARGAVRVGSALATSVDVFYLGSSTNPEFGYRAVLLLPSGATQIWTAPAGGTWQRIG
jgi:prepilin-type N-terminal cleavage/methylation domain-containing protein